MALPERGKYWLTGSAALATFILTARKAICKMSSAQHEISYENNIISVRKLSIGGIEGFFVESPGHSAYRA